MHTQRLRATALAGCLLLSFGVNGHAQQQAPPAVPLVTGAACR